MKNTEHLDLSLITEDRMRHLAHLLKQMSWRESIAKIWGTERAPTKGQLRKYVRDTYGEIGKFRESFGA